ncbi:MAG: LLM class flavin-dependent oxidoreductase [Chloroflexi bacterium]|nr:LLM class flavin-dependent oxidoreductase [Chloroflexota bacterium]
MVRFSIFDWIDESGRGLAQTYEERLKMLEFADEAGYYCYHLAEHHQTSLSTSPSPNVFLSAAAQRTKRLRLGALTYLLPHQNPLRLLEEIAMLDQLSRGRLEVGVSRGSAGEVGRGFNFVQGDARAIFKEALDIVVMGLKTGRIEYHGKYFDFDGVDTHLRPYQQPYPPLWYPTSNAESVPWLAAQGFSTVFGVNQHPTFDRLVEWMRLYRREWEAHRADPDRVNGHVSEPFYGFLVHTHVAENDEQARRQAKAGFSTFVENFTRRFVGTSDATRYAHLQDFEKMLDEGKVLVGSPATVRRLLGRYLQESGANYFVGSFAFGSLTQEQIMTSLNLFAREVMPAMTDLVEAA